MNISSYTLIPFVLQLLVIAVAPLTIPLWWERNRNKLLVSLVLSIPVILFLMSNDMLYKFEHQMLYDYVPFVVLLGALFVVTGGIHLSGDIMATPKTNAIFLAS